MLLLDQDHFLQKSGKNIYLISLLSYVSMEDFFLNMKEIKKRFPQLFLFGITNIFIHYNVSQEDIYEFLTKEEQEEVKRLINFYLNNISPIEGLNLSLLSNNFNSIINQYFSFLLLKGDIIPSKNMKIWPHIGIIYDYFTHDPFKEDVEKLKNYQIFPPRQLLPYMRETVDDEIAMRFVLSILFDENVDYTKDELFTYFNLSVKNLLYLPEYGNMKEDYLKIIKVKFSKMNSEQLKKEIRNFYEKHVMNPFVLTDFRQILVMDNEQFARFIVSLSLHLEEQSLYNILKSYFSYLINRFFKNFLKSKKEVELLNINGIINKLLITSLFIPPKMIRPLVNDIIENILARDYMKNNPELRKQFLGELSYVFALDLNDAIEKEYIPKIFIDMINPYTIPILLEFLSAIKDILVKHAKFLAITKEIKKIDEYLISLQITNMEEGDLEL